MRRHIVSLALIVALAYALPCPSRAQTPVAGVTVAQFRQLDWLQGAWLGSGGAYPAFYERYRAVNDSTIQMWGYSDSTFRAATDSSLIELRGGRITKSRGGRVQYQAVVLQRDQVKFLPVGSTTGGFTFLRRTGTEWTATLHPARTGQPETVYTMRRLRR